MKIGHDGVTPVTPRISRKDVKIEEQIEIRRMTHEEAQKYVDVTAFII
jgi:DNA-nicking Smr family endonuclease